MLLCEPPPTSVWHLYSTRSSFLQSLETLIKAVSKLNVCIHQPEQALHWRCWPTVLGKILVSAVDTLHQYCSLVYRSYYVFLIWAQCTNQHPWTSAVTPEIKDLNAPVANSRVYNQKDQLDSNIGDIKLKYLWHFWTLWGPKIVSNRKFGLNRVGVI